MIIEIRKAGFVNKGAELMLLSILNRLKDRYPDAVIVIEPTAKGSSQPWSKIVELGICPKASLYYKGIQWGRFAPLIPKKIREMYGLIIDNEINVVIDAAGFAYSDQWGLRSSLELADSSMRWRKQGTKVILMPQAFGPFKSPRIRNAIKRAANNVDLIMPREQISYDFLTDAVGRLKKISIYPDFTNLTEGVLPDYFDRNIHGVCLVPNYRMIDKTSGEKSKKYLPLIISCAKYLKKKNLNPFVLVHEGESDRFLASQISDGAGSLPVLTESDPLKIKGILGASHATIGSRFHGLVSALSQAVPSIATGWSHKYEELFREYSYAEGVVSVEASEQELYEKIDKIVDEPSRGEISRSLKKESQRLKLLSEEMWSKVYSILDSVASC
jgi:polysaccharide pyruvyl transferase WcaK-like protein